jgi:serine/threonine-protein kinase
MSARDPSPDAGLPPGSLLGAFEIVSRIGHGGMGAVYRVRNRITGEARALKVVLPELAASPEFVDRFIREIRLAIAVEHPNLVRVFEPGMDGDQMFLPMELLEGESLAARLRRDRRLTVDDTIGLLRSVGSALSALHARGILHRDVKPSNIFLAREGDQVAPKLLDLGAGKQVGATDEATATGVAIGSPHYMAPEQASGRRDLDARADQYALAVVAYQLLTGFRPYENDDTGHAYAKVLAGAAYKRPRELQADIPEAVEAAVLRAMSRAREARFPTVDAFVTALIAGPAGAAVPRPASPAASRQPPEEAPMAGRIDAERSGTVTASVVSALPARASTTMVWLAVGATAVLTVVAGVVWALGRTGGPSATPSATPPAMTLPPPVTSASPLPPAPASPSMTAPRPVTPTAPPEAVVTRHVPPAPRPAATASTSPPSRVPPPRPGDSAPTPAAGEPCRPSLGAPCF